MLPPFNFIIIFVIMLTCGEIHSWIPANIETRHFSANDRPENCILTCHWDWRCDSHSFLGLKCLLTNRCCTVSKSANLNSFHICRGYFHTQTYRVINLFYYWAGRRISILVDLIIYCSFALTSIMVFVFFIYLFQCPESWNLVLVKLHYM